MELKKKASWILAVGIGFMVISTWSETVTAGSPGLQVYQKACKKQIPPYSWDAGGGFAEGHGRL